jgi:2-hydroxymuconate-semialdehyde hydrolase
MKIREYEHVFEGLPVRFVEAGQGVPLLLLHGSGPGVSVQGNFARVLEPLAERYRVVGMDWIGFGGSGRREWPPFFDLSLWERQLRFALDRIASDAIGLLAHSIAASIAFRVAASDRRVTKILTTGAMGAPFAANDDTRRVWTFPATRADLRATLQCLVHDQAIVTEDFVQDRFDNLQRGDYRSYFSAMFAGDKQQYIDATMVPDQILKAVMAEVLMLHGRDDRPFPAATGTMALAPKLSRADMWILARCSHSVALEHPGKVLAAARMLFG